MEMLGTGCSRSFRDREARTPLDGGTCQVVMVVEEVPAVVQRYELHRHPGMLVEGGRLDVPRGGVRIPCPSTLAVIPRIGKVVCCLPASSYISCVSKAVV